MNFQSIYKAKDDKQSFNESIRSKDRPRQLVVLDEQNPMTLGFCLGDVIERLDQLQGRGVPDTLDRSGATHHSIESRISLSSRPVFPPPSVGEYCLERSLCLSIVTLTVIVSIMDA